MLSSADPGPLVGSLGTLGGVSSSASSVLSSAQMETLAANGEERTADVGETLFEVGDATYPFIAILEGEAAILDAAGQRDRPPRRRRASSAR